MKTLTITRGPSESPSAAEPEPRWVMLNSYGYRGEDDDAVVADAKTVAGSCTSVGRYFRVSFGIAAPPACSFIYSDLVGRAPAIEEKFGPPKAAVIAAHGDSILIQMTYDYFVYRAGGASRLPSLSLIPPGCALMQQNSGILRRGEDELIVAGLLVAKRQPQKDTAELRVLRLGNDDWETKTAVPIAHDGGDGLPDYWWNTVVVVPVGDRYLCWVNYLSGFLLWDMADEASSPKLRYVRLPAALADVEDDKDDGGNSCDGYGSDGYNKPTLKCSRNMYAAGACAVRLVSVNPRCCCGGSGSSSCSRSRYAFTVTTWTLALRTDEPMEWVKDGVLDSDELWALPEYGDLPRVLLEYPVVSSDDPDVVCFMVHNDDYGHYCADRKAWMVEVNTTSKTLRSVLPWRIDPWKAESIVTAKLHY